MIFGEMTEADKEWIHSILGQIRQRSGLGSVLIRNRITVHILGMAEFAISDMLLFLYIVVLFST